MAECQCGRKFCYGTLFRGFDTMPLKIMEQNAWKCPHCEGRCFAGACRKDPRQKPYEPKGTLLGHDTKKVADVRSVESLVDFSLSNIFWLKETVDAPVNNARLDRRQEQANREKENDIELDGHYASDTEDVGYRQGLEAGISYSHEPDVDQSMIDPNLQGADDAVFQAPSANTGSNLATLLNHDIGNPRGNHDGYQPAQQTGYIAPAAVMMGGPDAEGDEDEDLGSYEELGGGRGKKRRRATDGDEIKRLPPKRRRPEDRESLPTSSKQYRKEQERKALEEARKAGRFIQVHAVLKGKSRVIRLKIGRGNMLRIAQLQAEKEAGTHNDLLKSDVAPPAAAAQPGTAASNAKTSRAVRVRVERDDNFRAKSRKPYAPRSSDAMVSRPKKKGQQFEELEIDSEFSSDDDDVQADGAVQTTGNRKQRRNAWQSKRYDEGDSDVPDMLPDDYRDRGRDRPNRPKKPDGVSATGTPASTKKVATKSAMHPTPTNKGSIQTQTVIIDDASGDEEDSVLGDGADDAHHVNTAAAALRHQQEEERTRRAKLRASQLDDAADEDDEDEDDDEMANVKGVASSLAPTVAMGRDSLGAKIQTAQSSAGATPAKAVMQNGGFKAANGRP